MLALVAWLVEGCDTVTGRAAVIWSLAFVVAIGTFDHCVATTVSAFASMLDGAISFGDVAKWFAPTFLGNVFGGVAIVAAINYGQVREED